MEAPVLDHLLRTMAAVPPGRRVLVRGTTTADDEAAPEDRSSGEGRVAGALARLGLEVHAAPWTDEAARRVHQSVEEGTASGSREEEDAHAVRVYATAAPAGALPYPEAHFGWVVVVASRLEGTAEEEREEALRALLEEARHHLRPGGWVFVAAPPGAPPEVLGEVAEQAALAEAEAPERAGDQVHGIYRRVEEDTPP